MSRTSFAESTPREASGLRTAAAVAGFELRYILRNPLVWATAVGTLLMFGAGMSVDGFDLGNEGGLLKNAAYATLRNYVMISMLFMFVTTAFVANAVLRDDETGYGPIIRSTGITRLEYVLGRFAGAFVVAALLLLIVPLASMLGTAMPWAPADQLGPTRLGDHLYGYFLVGLPNLFTHGAIFFALATITRSMMATYLGAVGFMTGFFVLNEGYAGKLAVAMAEPFAGRALKDAVRYWTIAQRNVQLPELAGGFLYNRLLWLGIAAAFLALACVVFRFADGVTLSRARGRRATSAVEGPGSGAPAPAPSHPALRAAAQDDGLPSPRHDARALRALVWMRTKFEARQVILSPALPVVLAWGLITTIYALAARDSAGRPNFPTTLTLIPHVKEAFEVVLLVIAIFYAGELVWRERDRRIHEIVDATPMPSWAYVVPKTLAMALVLVSIVLVNAGAAVLFQLAQGYTDVEPAKYLLWYVLPATWDVLLVAVLAVFLQALSPHKTVGWAIMVGFIIWQYLNNAIDHDLLNYGATPGTPLSDMNGAGSFWKGAWVVRLYWGAFAVLLLLAAHLLWRRGTEARLRPRLAGARRRLRGGAGLVAAAALLVFTATGACAFYNINVLNTYRWPLAGLARQAAFEKQYWKYHDVPQPTIADMTVTIDLYPEERRAETKGRYLLRNLTTRPVDEVHVRLADDDLELIGATMAGARLRVDDREHRYRIFRLDSAMRPGEERVLTFATRRWHRGFRNGKPNTRLVENGTFLDNYELTPVIGGMDLNDVLHDPAARRHYGLPRIDGRKKLEDTSATARTTTGGGWTSADITVSTSADQTPIAPGRRVSDVTRGGRRTARFVSEAPMRDRFSVQSARYAEKHRLHDGVDLAVYYHPAHAWNVDRMLNALAVSLDEFRARYGPYPFSHVRIVEYPGFANFAQAFAGTVPYSETYGFIADFRSPTTIDHVSATTAHELAHQWWGHQITGADVEGSLVLSETLANYSAIGVLSRLGGEAERRRGLRYMLDRYLASRASGGAVGEPPLARVETQSWITYQKGAHVMYLLQQRLGEDAVNRALRALLAKYRFKGAPYPRSLDLVAALRAEAKTDEQQQLITDLFERVVLYDLKAGTPTAVRRADGRWDVSVPVETRKYAVDSRGTESETPLAEHIEVGLFTADPGDEEFDAKHVIVMERRLVRSGAQTLRFVTDQKPTHAGIDPYNYYIDRRSGDNVRPLVDPE